MVIVQPFFGSVKEYIVTVLTQGCPFSVPERCPHPDCQAAGSLIRWGTYERGALTGEADHRIRIQRVRCKTCGRTHSLLPNFLHPHRHFVISLLQQVISLYLLAGLGWRRLMRQAQAEYARGPAPSTVREWVASFAYGAGQLLLDALLRHLFALDPGLDLPDLPPEHLDRVPDPNRSVVSRIGRPFFCSQRRSMNTLERNTIKTVAKLSPWLAPLPSAYFVARSAMVHLALPLSVAIVVAGIIETLGLATTHTALWAYEWNVHKRKTDPTAPVALAVALGVVYVIATLSLVVFLEVWPFLAVYAPAIFPALTVVGALNLALASRQEQREAAVKAEKSERKAESQSRRQSLRKADIIRTSGGTSRIAESDTFLDAARQIRMVKRDARKNALLTYYASNPDAGPTEAGRAIGVSRQTVYVYLSELEAAGRVSRRDGNRIDVLDRKGAEQ